MADKTVKVRLKNKADTSENWAKATSFIPLDGELIFYTDLNKVKMGDGKTAVSSLPFLDAAEAEKLVSGGNDIDVAQTLYVTNSAAGTGISANSLKRPYLDGNGYYQEMVNNQEITSTYDDGTEYKVSDYQYKRNFDSGIDSTYIDTHLGANSSIYTRVQGENSYLNTNVSGDGSFLFTSFSDAGIDFIASGDKDKSGSLNYFLVQCSYNGQTDSTTVPLVYITHQTADSEGNMVADSSANKYGFAYDSVRNQIGYVERDSNGILKFVDTKYVPQKFTSGTFVYAHSGDSQSEIEYTALPIQNTIVARAYDGNFCSSTPTANEHVVNKQYADSNYVHKLSTSGYKLYAHSGDSQYELDYNINATKSSVAQRDANGNVIMTNPQTALAGVNKQYADSNYVDLSTNQTIVGEKHFSAGNTTNANVVYYEDGTVFEKKTTIKAGNTTNANVVYYEDGTVFENGKPVTLQGDTLIQAGGTSLHNLSAYTNDTILEKPTVIKAGGGDSVNINAGTSDTYFGKPVTLGSASKADYSVTASSDGKTIANKEYVDSSSSSVQSKLQEEIDAINASQNFVATYASKADMPTPPVSGLEEKDCVLVLKDEDHKDQAYVYKYNSAGWVEVGPLGDYYTKAEIKDMHAGIETAYKAYSDASKTEAETYASNAVKAVFTATSSSTEVSE